MRSSSRRSRTPLYFGMRSSSRTILALTRSASSPAPFALVADQVSGPIVAPPAASSTFCSGASSQM